MDLALVWFVLIAVLWIGYFVLEGFDFGVGMLLPVLGKTDAERRVMINTIGPVWDGNEVWLLTAGGAMFAAFPEWYATLFSGLLPPAAAHPGRADRARRRVRVPRQAGRRSAGRRRWDWAHHHRLARARAAVGRRLRQHRARRADRRGRAPTRAASSPCSTRTPCSAGWSRSACSPRTAPCSSRSRPSATSGTGPTRSRAGRGWPRRSPRCCFLGWTLLDAGEHRSPGSRAALAAVALLAALAASRARP